MPLVDRRTDSVVLRIVYDGPPESGKTTNLRLLCERLSLGRRGELHTPGGGERTQFFDWLDVTGGYIAGRRIRCQLVTVPGQIELARRRSYLLDSADVVVFVVDARPPGIDEARRSLALLRRVMLARDGLPLLVQANKQDVAAALAPEQVGGALAIDGDVPIVAAQACHGVGVLETFMLAVRLAVDRIRVAIARGQVDEGDGGSPATLLAELRGREVEVERALESVVAAAVAATLTDEAVVAPLTDEAVVAPLADEPVAAPPPPAAPEAAPSVDPDPVLPRADVAVGLVWPPQSGRFALRALDDERTRGATARRRGEDAFSCGSWVLHRRGPWASLDEARAQLLAAVSRQPAIGALVPASRTLAVAGDAGTYWVWYFVEATRSLADAVQAGDAGVDDRCAAAADLVGRLSSIAARLGIAIDHTAAAFSDDGQQYVGPAWPGEPVPADEARRRLAGSIDELRAPVDEVIEIAEVAAQAELAHSLDLGDDEGTPFDLAGGDESVAWELPTVGIPAGMVWPQVRGRVALSSLVPPGQRSRGEIRPWAPRDALEVSCSDWLAHTCDVWRFDDLDDGRRALLETVRWQTRLGALTPPGRTLALCPSDHEARLWMLTSEQVPSCWHLVAATLASGDRAAIAAARQQALAALEHVRGALSRLGIEAELALDLIAIDGEPRLLSAAPPFAQPDAGARLADQLAVLGRAC